MSRIGKQPLPEGRSSSGRAPADARADALAGAPADARVHGSADARADAPPSFLVDEMLGRLGRWLRVLGYDAEDAGGRDDDALLRVAESERRMLLTRDTRFVERRAVRRGSVSALLVLHDHLTDQLRQLHEELGITQVGPPRCLVCNSALVNIEREQVRGLVPEYVYCTQSRFRYCPHCDRVVWPGTHWQEMRRVLSAQGIISADPSWKG